MSDKKLKPRKNQPVFEARDTDETECGDCPATCCHNLSITILKPNNKHEEQELLWHLNYDTVKVYIQNKRWHVYVKGRCMYLNDKNLCSIYEGRFDKCRNHMPPSCERFTKWYDKMFTTREELEKYFDAERRKRSRKRAKQKAAKAK